jgi:uncharacterized protein (TIGR00251 family)
MPESIRQEGTDVLVFVRAKPRASRSVVLGEREGELEVALQAPPVDGAANEELVRFIAKKVGVPRSRVVLHRGETSRHKVLRLREMTLEAALRALLS